MRKTIIGVFVLIGFLCWISYASEIMKLSDIKAGMEGEGQTIFKGSEIETFRFKVLGIWEKVTFDKHLIIVELISPVLEESGLIQGMSGSPLYIDGKIIGSVSYGFSFAKKPLAAATPIEDIIKTSEYNKTTGSIEISNIKIDFQKENVQYIKQSLQNELSKRISFSPVEYLKPIKLLANSYGFSGKALEYMNQVFPVFQNIRLSQKIDKKALKENIFDVSPAEAIAIPLVRGDFEYSASGTVTYIKGKKIYMFGHPFFNLGTVSFPIHKAEVITVWPSYRNSFKLTTTKHMIGTVEQDRFSGVQGELGKKPYMIPMKLFLKNRNRNFNVEMVNHPLLTPILSYISLLNVFMAEYQEYGFNSIRVTGKIFIENEKNVIIDDLFSGTTAFDDFSNLVLVINYFLMNNKERPIKIQKIDFDINGSETIRKADIDNVLIERNSYLPGEVIPIVLYFKNERGSSFEEKVRIRAPNLKPGSPFYLMVADAREITKFDSKIIKTGYFPSRLNTLIRAINNIRKNNRVYFKLFVPVQGLFIRGYEYSHLPLSLKNILIYNSSARAQSEMIYSTIKEYQMEVPAMVSGIKIFKLQIKERKNE